MLQENFSSIILLFCISSLSLPNIWQFFSLYFFWKCFQQGLHCLRQVWKGNWFTANNCGIGASSWAENMSQPSRSTNIASQRLNNLRLKVRARTHMHTHLYTHETHTCIINQMMMCQPTVSFLGRCLQTVCVDQTLPVWVSEDIFFSFLKMRGWVEQLVETHLCWPCLVSLPSFLFTTTAGECLMYNLMYLHFEFAYFTK